MISNDAKCYLRNPLYFSWTGIPLDLWPCHLRRRECNPWHGAELFYRTYPCDGIESLASDVGNLFQHVFYNGEVHLYDEFDEQEEQIITQEVIKTHDTRSALCAARYLNDQFFNEFFNVYQCKYPQKRYTSLSVSLFSFS